jgi:hypothetical protein
LLSIFFIKALHSEDEVNNTMPFSKAVLHAPVALQISTLSSLESLSAEAQLPLPSIASTKSAMVDSEHRHVMYDISSVVETAARIGAQSASSFKHFRYGQKLLRVKSVGVTHLFEQANCASEVKDSLAAALGSLHWLFSTMHPVEMGQHADK